MAMNGHRFWRWCANQTVPIILGGEKSCSITSFAQRARSAARTWGVLDFDFSGNPNPSCLAWCISPNTEVWTCKFHWTEISSFFFVFIQFMLFTIYIQWSREVETSCSGRTSTIYTLQFFRELHNRRWIPQKRCVAFACVDGNPYGFRAFMSQCAMAWNGRSFGWCLYFMPNT